MVAATVVTPQSFNHAANASRSPVFVPNLRTPGGNWASGAGLHDYEANLIALRDQIAEEKPEDLASLVEQMTRVQSLAQSRPG